MKIQIRQGVFETNSSSTHSLSIFKENDWERFKKGELVITNYPENPVLVEINSINPKHIYDSEKEELGVKWYDYKYFTYSTFKYVGSYDLLFKKFAGSIIMSLYGYSG